MMQYSIFSCSELNKFIGQFKCVGKKFAQKVFIFAQFLEKFAQKQNMPKFWKNLPNFQKLPNTCSPASVRKQRTDEVKVLWYIFSLLIMWSLLSSVTGHSDTRTGEPPSTS